MAFQMKITFIGAAHEVTGSLTLIEIGGSKLLVDCGMEQGRDIFVNQTLPVDAASIDAVLLTHAHIDHSGNLPLLDKCGFRGTVYATTATCGLADIMLRDCAQIQESDAEWKNRKRKRSDSPEVVPVYTMKDAENLLRRLRPVDPGKTIRILEGVEVRFTDIGHLLGSAAIEVFLTEGNESRKFVFSGDVGNINKPIVPDPTKIRDADYVMIESTYGTRLHEEEKTDHVGMLAQVIEKTLDRGGNVVIPSFAVGRTQEILYMIRLAKLTGKFKRDRRFRVVVDSPLAEEATSIFLQSDTVFFDEETADLITRGINPLYFDGLEPSVSAEESKALNDDPEPKVIISASGMCEAGRIRHHLKHNLWRPECTILFCGYQTNGTLGRAILDGAEKIKLFGETIAVRAEVRFLPGSSSHADKAGLIDWLSGFEQKPLRVFVNHGDDEVCTEFARILSEECGFNAFAPYSGTEFDPVKNEFIRITEGVPVKEEKPEKPRESEGARRAKQLSRELAEAAAQLRKAIEAAENASNSDKQKLIKELKALMKTIGA